MSNKSNIINAPLNIVDNIPNNWSSAKLVDICTPKQWKTISENFLESVGFRVYGANGFIGYYKEYNHEEETITVTCRGATCGTVNLIPPKSYITGNAMCLDNIKKTIIKKYLFYAISFRTVSDVISGSAQPQITRDNLKSVDLPIPPLSEQKKIASILNSVEEVIEKTQSQINKLQDLKISVINELLTKGIGHTEFKDSDLGRIPKNWQILKVLKLLEFKNGLNKEKSAFGKGNPIVNYMDVFLNPVIYSNKITGKVSLKDTEIERFKVNTGDIFFTRTSETVEEIGMSSVIIKTADKTTFSGFILRGRPITKFLYPSLSGYFFRTNYVREQIKKTCSFTTRALTNGSLLGEVVVMLPTLDEQKLIFKILDDINNLILKKNSLIKKHVLLKKSLMQDLLTGKVRVSVN